MTHWFTPLALLLALSSLSASAAWADEPTSSEGLNSMLDNVPTIESKPVPTAEEKPEEVQVDLASYIKDCRAAVLAKWTPGAKLIKKHPQMEAQILIKIGEDGSILSLSPAKLSGNKSFDASAIEALNAASPLPVPHPSLALEAERGIVIIFSAAKYGK